jgi:hypothetical protein
MANVMAKRTWSEASDGAQALTVRALHFASGTGLSMEKRDVMLIKSNKFDSSFSPQAVTATNLSLKSLEGSRHALRAVNLRSVVNACRGRVPEIDLSQPQIKCQMDEGGPPCRRCAERDLGCVLSKNLQSIIDEKTQ